MVELTSTKIYAQSLRGAGRDLLLHFLTSFYLK